MNNNQFEVLPQRQPDPRFRGDLGLCGLTAINDILYDQKPSVYEYDGDDAREHNDL